MDSSTRRNALLGAFEDLMRTAGGAVAIWLPRRGRQRPVSSPVQTIAGCWSLVFLSAISEGDRSVSRSASLMEGLPTVRDRDPVVDDGRRLARQSESRLAPFPKSPSPWVLGDGDPRTMRSSRSHQAGGSESPSHRARQHSARRSSRLKWVDLVRGAAFAGVGLLHSGAPLPAG